MKKKIIFAGLVVLLFVAGIVSGCRERFFRMLLAWFACDVTLHLVLGFAINEVYIMTAGWAFIIPVACGYLLRRLPQRLRRPYRWLLAALTAFLWMYNAGLTAFYLCSRIC